LLMRETIDLYDREGFEAARQKVLTDRGRRVMDDIRKLVGEMDRAERTVLLDRGSTARTSARLTLVVLLVGDVIAFGLVGSSYVIAMRGLGERRRHVAQVEEGRRGAGRRAAELAAPALVGYAELLGDADLAPAERAECLATLRRNGEHLMAIVNDVLDLSKIESGRMTVERIACSPFALVAEVAELLRPRAAQEGLALEVLYRGPVPETVESDPTRLRQILLNLVGNALNFPLAVV